MNTSSNRPFAAVLFLTLFFCLGSSDPGRKPIHVFDEEERPGNRLVGFNQNPGSHSFDLYFEIAGDKTRTPIVTTPDVLHARFSPNGELVAYHRLEPGEGCNLDNGNGAMQRVHVFSLKDPSSGWTSGNCAFNFEWSADSKLLAYNINRLGPDFKEAGCHVHVLDLETRQEHQVTSGPHADLTPRFSPDGKWILYLPSLGRRSGPRESQTLALIDWRSKTEIELLPEDKAGQVCWPDGPESVRIWTPQNILVWDVTSPLHPERHGSWALDIVAKQCWKFSDELGAMPGRPTS